MTIHKLTLLPDRVRSKIAPVETGCWLWSGATINTGYGSVYAGELSDAKSSVLAHRLVYELLVGEIPEGLEADHLCRVPLCVNPSHLELVTHAENVRRGDAPQAGGEYQLSKTHCPQGHEYSGDNLYVVPSSGHRHCRQCRQVAGRKYKMKKKRDAGFKKF